VILTSIIIHGYISISPTHLHLPTTLHNNTNLPRDRRQVPILIIPRLKKRITQRDRFNTLHIRIHDKLGINIKENRHIHRLARIQPLLLKTKTLYLAEIRRHLARRHAVGCDADDVFGGLVGCRVEG
jgi:hypothetical protein